MNRNQKKRFVTQLLILVLACVSILAVCNYMDKSNSIETNISKDSQKPITYYSSSLVESKRVKFENGNDTMCTPECIGQIDAIDSSHCDYSLPDVIIPCETSDNSLSAVTEIGDSADDFKDESLPIPSGMETSFMSYMDYRALTNTASKQWQLQQSAWTDSDGFRRIGDDYCVALGTIYGEIGDRFIITTDEGNTYTAIMSDAKGSDAVFYDNVHSWYHYAGNGCNVVEFVVQTEYLPSAVTISGSCGAVDYLSGNIVSIERI